MTPTRHIASNGPELMVLTLILGDQLHRDWFSPSPIQLAAGNRVLMIEDLAVASAYRYHKLRLLHTFVAMRSFRDALVERGLTVHYFELADSLSLPFWKRLEAELGDGRELQVAAIVHFYALYCAFCVLGGNLLHHRHKVFGAGAFYMFANIAV